MNVEFFAAKRELYLFRYKNQEVTKENIAQWASDEIWFEPTENELEILYTYLTEGEEKGDEVYKKTIEDELSQMSEDEQCEKFLEFYQNGIYEPIILNSLKNKMLLIDNVLEKQNTGLLLKLMNDIGIECIAEYINKNGQQKETIKLFISNESGPAILKNLLSLIENDAERAEIVFNSVNTNSEKGKLLHNIENEYYRIQIVRITSTGSENYSKEELLANIRNYDSHKANLDRCESEEEKVKYINGLEDLDLRVVFLKDIQVKENRDAIIDSLSCEIDPQIEPQVKLVQGMITEFFEDKLGEKFDDDKRERLRIAFNKTDVNYRKLDNNQNGIANYVLDSISIHSRHQNNINKTISFLIHEYGHILSQNVYKTTRHSIPKSIDEGAQDLFSELVINHYLEKHKSVELEGKKVRMEYPYVSYSGYNKENMWIRTILAPLEKEGTDIEAFSEFQLGDKLKYLELAFGPEEAKNVEIDQFGNPDINTSFSQIYRAHKDSFDDLNANSIYQRRNKLLPLFKLQRWIEPTGENILGGGNYNTSAIANLIFENRKIYEIPREELQEFANLYYAQDGLAMIKYDEFANSKIRELTNDEIDNYSFEVINSSMALWCRLENAGTALESVWGRALTREIEKIEHGQELKTSLDKYKAIFPNFIEMLTKKSTDANEYILDRVKDLQFAYLEQIEEAVLEGHSEEVIKGLTDEETGKMYIDSRNSRSF